MFRTGDIVVYNTLDRFINFTQGKKYVVEDVFFRINDEYVEICVKDDLKKDIWIHSKVFISLKEYRKQKLNEICSE